MIAELQDIIVKEIMPLQIGISPRSPTVQVHVGGRHEEDGRAVQEPSGLPRLSAAKGTGSR